MKKLSAIAGFSAALILALTAAGNASAVELKHKAVKDCAACHTQDSAVKGNAFVVPDSKACLTCHGDRKALAEKTKPADPRDPNPHASHHYGDNIACTACHSEHGKSEVYCNNCHAFPFKPIR